MVNAKYFWREPGWSSKRCSPAQRRQGSTKELCLYHLQARMLGRLRHVPFPECGALLPEDQPKTSQSRSTISPTVLTHLTTQLIPSACCIFPAPQPGPPAISNAPPILPATLLTRSFSCGSHSTHTTP